MRELLNDSRKAIGILENLAEDELPGLCSEKKNLLRRVAIDLLTVCRAPGRFGAMKAADECTKSPLSARETEVAEWMAEGLTDGEIAAALGVSTRTVNTHRDTILRKLNLRSRSSVASWVAKRKETSGGFSRLA